MRGFGTKLLVLGVALLASLGCATRQQVPEGAVTAIDVLLVPDATMVTRAESVNARLCEMLPEGFALDATHRPHVTCLQAYVRTADLHAVDRAVGAVLARERPVAWRLEAVELYAVPWGDLALAGIAVQPTMELVRFQQELIDAVAPFTVPAGTVAAFFTTAAEPDVGQSTIDYVAGFVPNASGVRFRPHVTVGLAPRSFLDAVRAEDFEPFTFSPVSVSIYQLGDFGTARAELRTWSFGTR